MPACLPVYPTRYSGADNDHPGCRRPQRRHDPGGTLQSASNVLALRRQFVTPLVSCHSLVGFRLDIDSARGCRAYSRSLCHLVLHSLGPTDGDLSDTLMPSLQFRKMRKRACTSKVRTGCITCKERRVKCDEVKPICLRCTRAGQICKGYMPLLSEPRPRKPEPATRRLLPRQTPSKSSGLAITVGRALPFIRLDGSDVLYFDFFRSEAVKELSGYLPSTFWSRIVLCESLTDPCIRHAILALGAASYPLVARNQHLPRSSTNNATLNAHGRAAICHHTKALSLFREMMANSVENFPSRSVFIATPLLVAFTMLQSNNQAAEALLSGLKALQEVCHIWQGKKAGGGPAGPSVNEEMESLTCPMLQVYSKQHPAISKNLLLPYFKAATRLVLVSFFFFLTFFQPLFFCAASCDAVYVCSLRHWPYMLEADY